MYPGKENRGNDDGAGGAQPAGCDPAEEDSAKHEYTVLPRAPAWPVPMRRPSALQLRRGGRTGQPIERPAALQATVGRESSEIGRLRLEEAADEIDHQAQNEGNHEHGGKREVDAR